MLDITQYHHEKTRFANAVIAITKENYEPNKQFTIYSHVEPFLEAACLKYPQWTFYGKASRNYNADGFIWRAEKFYVYQGREQLGNIEAVYARGGWSYRVDNERIENLRQRGTGITTSDLKKAIKNMAKMFGVRTLAERMNVAIGMANATVASTRDYRQHELRNTYYTLTHHLQDYLFSRLDETIAEAVKAGAGEVVTKLPSMIENNRITQEINECRVRGDGVVVMIHGSDYAVQNVKDGEHGLTMYSTDNLPTHIKRAVGMLKLVEPKDCMSGIGCRVADNVFFVTSQPEAKV
jgi:predicted RecB family endonuclease